MRRDITGMSTIRHQELINTELMMLQQICIGFNKPYSISIAKDYLNKLDINVSESQLKYMYSKEELTYITDYRENRVQELEKFLNNVENNNS
tara:strand:+ start:660 stop:935 length:276 start_codon:yes stop_codon:yes gene_type:complete